MSTARRRVLEFSPTACTRAEGEAGARGRRQRRCRRRLDRRRHVGNAGAAAGADRRSPITISCDPIFWPTGCRRRIAASDRRQGRVCRDGCSTASPARAKPRSISRRSRTPPSPAGEALILMRRFADGIFLDHFAARFGVRPAEWRIRNCRRANMRAPGRPSRAAESVVVGACRHFAYADLGLIIVDEEHDPAFSRRRRALLARDMAVVRGHIAELVVLCLSHRRSRPRSCAARPYVARRLPERLAANKCPSVAAIDLRQAPPPRGRFISPVLAGAVRSRLERKEQALLFLNRRGYAPLTLCRAAGFPFPVDCDAGWSMHRFRKRFVCHHCGFMHAVRPIVRMRRGKPPCRLRPGVERLRRARVVSPGTCWCCPAIVATVERMREEFADISPPGLFDHCHRHPARGQGPSLPDAQSGRRGRRRSGLEQWRSARRRAHLQLLHQVVGRAGRDAGIGRGYLQTHQPEHPVMRALIAQDREAFYDAEIGLREKTHYPPLAAALRSSSGPTSTTPSRMPAPWRGPRRRRKRCAFRPRRSTTRAGARPPPFAAVDPGAARVRSFSLHARVAWRRAEGEGQYQARYRRRSAELFMIFGRAGESW